MDTIDKQIEKRKIVANAYKSLLKEIEGITFLEEVEGVKHNYSYFPIYVNYEYPLTRDELYQKLKDNNILGRRYFYPLMSDFATYRSLPSAKHENLPVAVKTANAVICLPIYPELTSEEIEYIVEIIRKN